MVQKALLRNRSFIALAMLSIFFFSCRFSAEKKPESVVTKDYSIDISGIPKDTVFANDTNLALKNGIYHYKQQPFSGIINELYEHGKLKKQFSVYQGQLHGVYKSYYEDGKAWEIRRYKNNLSTGTHQGYWPFSGKQKFEYQYYEERMEGLQKKWYKSGKPHLFLTYVNDREEGLQQGWRENGKLYLNYVAKDGYRYGLQKAVLCYSLRNEKVENQVE